jgi:BirA family biotin operon repressor/biotin-[acetyl-CoA-carboxylase] ligase
LEIYYLEKLDSTHLFLERALRENNLKAPVAIVANKQTNGVGSGDNSWHSEEGNIFLSFAIKMDKLPSDLPMASASIYFSFIMKELLVELGSKVWLKWPNDFYIQDKKIGGTITKLISKDLLLCSMGINIKSSPKDFDILDINVKKNRLLDLYFLKLKQDIFWKNIFSNYEIEFVKSKNYSYFDRVLSKRVSLKDATLNSDGSIMIENRKVYSLR